MLTASLKEFILELARKAGHHWLSASRAVASGAAALQRVGEGSPGSRL